MSFLEENRHLIFKKYSDEELLKDIDSYVNGKGRLNKILNHFFEEIIFESCGRGSNISPMDVLKDDEKIKEIFEYIKTKPNFYKGNDIQNLKSYLRNAVSWVRKVANFPAREAYHIQNRYNFENKKLYVLDTSAGFGSRMSASLLFHNYYCGIDPNPNLYQKLNEYFYFLQKNNLSKKNHCLIYCQGSEVKIDRLIEKCDISFTSPPYFNLEYYYNDNSESTKNYDNYSLWTNNFVAPTIKNTYLYLKKGGYAMINIKNLNDKYPLYDSFYETFNSIDGFEFKEVFDMKISSKKNYGMSGNYDIPNKEPVMVFKKVK